MQASLRSLIRSRASFAPTWRMAQTAQHVNSMRFRAVHSKRCSLSSLATVLGLPSGYDSIAKRYTVEHELVNFDDTTGVGIVSITDHAQSVLGDVVYVELPPVGTSFQQGGRGTVPAFRYQS